MRPQVGWWTTICCDLDLRQIENEIDLAQLLADADEDGRRFWATREEAIAEVGTSAETEAKQTSGDEKHE